MRPGNCRRHAGFAVIAAVLLMAGASRAGVEDEIVRLREELVDIKKDLAEIKAILQVFLRAQNPQQVVTAVVSVAGRPSLGRPDAPVTLVEFSDYQCPFCKRHSTTVYPLLKKDYVDTGKIRYVMRDFPIARLHPLAEKAHEAAHCAGEQQRYWEMHDLLFAKSPDLTVPALKKYAVEVGLNADQFDNCLDSDKYVKEVDQEIRDGEDAGIRGTPSFFAGRTESGEKITGTMIAGAQPLENFKRVIDGLLATGDNPREK